MKLTRRNIFGLLVAPFAIFTKSANGEEKNPWYPDVPKQELIADTSKQKISELHEFLGNLLKQYGKLCQSEVRMVTNWIDELKKPLESGGNKLRPFKWRFLNRCNEDPKLIFYKFEIVKFNFTLSSWMSHEQLWDFIEYAYVTEDIDIIDNIKNINIVRDDEDCESYGPVLC